MNLRLDLLVAPLSVLALASPVYGQHSAMPAGMTHEEHMAQMNAQGKKAMGFDQETTVHHFRLAATGGSIAVDAKVPSDVDARAQIRSHLKEITAAFKQGDFTKPLLTHGEQPPGVPVLQKLRADVTYSYEDTEQGGLVRVMTRNAEALAALHAFLKYQISEHATGDPLTVFQDDRP